MATLADLVRNFGAGENSIGNADERYFTPAGSDLGPLATIIRTLEQRSREVRDYINGRGDTPARKISRDYDSDASRSVMPEVRDAQFAKDADLYSNFVGGGLGTITKKGAKALLSPGDINAQIKSATIRIGGKEFDGVGHFDALNKARDAGVDLKTFNRENGDYYDRFRLIDDSVITKDEATARGATSVKSEEMPHGQKKVLTPDKVNERIAQAAYDGRLARSGQSKIFSAADDATPDFQPRARETKGAKVEEIPWEIVNPPKGSIPKFAANQRSEAGAYPGIYRNPIELSYEAASRVAPEDPLLKQLFGVTRDDLYQIGEQGRRQGNLPDIPFKTASGARGADVAQHITTPENEQRLLDLITEARKHPDLYRGMASWYVMDPAYKQFVRLYGEEAAPVAYKQFNSLTGMASPGSEVLTELNRGTAANMMATRGEFDKFRDYAGIKVEDRGADFPAELAAVIPHPYHPTAHAGPMEKYVNTGEVDMGSAKVPSYILASGVPDTGFQTKWAVGDAHWSRLVGLPEFRNLVKNKEGVLVPNGASASVPEMVSLAPWWEQKIAQQAGIEAVPAQAVVWGAGSGATGVTSPIGAGKLELLAIQIGKAARRLGVSPETARDMILTGRAHAGFIDPELLAVLGTGAGAAAAAAAYNMKDDSAEE